MIHKIRYLIKMMIERERRKMELVKPMTFRRWLVLLFFHFIIGGPTVAFWLWVTVIWFGI